MNTTVTLPFIRYIKCQTVLAPLRPAEQGRNRTGLYNCNIPVTLLIYKQITRVALDSAPHCITCTPLCQLRTKDSQSREFILT